MKIEIHLDNPTQTYSGAATVSGEVTVDLSDEEITSGLTLKCLGEAQVHSLHVEKSNPAPTQITYFEHDLLLFGPHNNQPVNRRSKGRESHRSTTDSTHYHHRKVSVDAKGQQVTEPDHNHRPTSDTNQFHHQGTIDSQISESNRIHRITIGGQNSQGSKMSDQLRRSSQISDKSSSGPIHSASIDSSSENANDYETLHKYEHQYHKGINADPNAEHHQNLSLFRQRTTEDEIKLIMPPGLHSFPFSFDLTDGLPSSFEGNNADVQYSLEAKLHRSWHVDQSTKLYFIVKGQLDLNHFPESSRPAEIRDEEKICCFCCKSGPIGFTLKLDRTGFLIGDSLGFVVNMYNRSSRCINKTNLRIMQNVSYYEDIPTYDSTEVFEIHGPTLEAGEIKVWEETDVIIPDNIPPTNLGGCKLIQVDYELVLTLFVPNGINIVGSIPIVIGTIPFISILFDELSSTCSRVLPDKIETVSFQVSQSGGSTEPNSSTDVPIG